MLRIRFPNGQCVTYNHATDHNRDVDGNIEVTRRDGEKNFWVALIPKGTNCIIEHVEPCAVRNPLQSQAPESACKTVLQHLRTLPSHQVRELKTALRDFNARSQCWRT